MHNVIVALLPDARIDCCSFHLGPAWWRNIQRIGLSSEYKDKSGEIGKWLSKFVGLPYIISIFASMDGVKLVKELRTILKCSINKYV
jgi:hypothetical protein